jgi:hypothetical protein
MRNINRVVIDIIPHNQQRYPTSGDWYFDKQEPNTLVIKVSKMKNPVFEQAVILHELTEAFQCNLDGVTEEMVDNFDIHGAGKDQEDPGMDISAPYHNQHMFAVLVENAFVCSNNISNDEYTNTFDEQIITDGI